MNETYGKVGGVTALAADTTFCRQARRFAEWFGRERRAALELGKIAHLWLDHYSRTRNAEILARALYEVTGLRVTGRTLRNYRDIFRIYEAWQGRPKTRGTKSGNHFHICHVGPGHLRVAAAAKIPESQKLRLLDEAEKERLTVKQATARARKLEMEVNRSKRTARRRASDPRVICGDTIDVVRRLEPGAICSLIADWQWDTCGIWQDVERPKPVHRPDDPVDHLCRLLQAARPYMDDQCIVWIFGRTTAFEGGQIGLPWSVQQTAHDIGLRYCSEYVFQHSVAGYRSKSTFLAIKHTPIFPFAPEGFDCAPVEFLPSVSRPLRAASRSTHIKLGTEKHPYQKPVELFEQLISAGTPGGLVFDGFAGSGAAGVAAVRCGCPYLGAELQPYYVRTANRAIAAAMSKRSVKSA